MTMKVSYDENQGHNAANVLPQMTTRQTNTEILHILQIVFIVLNLQSRMPPWGKYGMICWYEFKYVWLENLLIFAVISLHSQRWKERTRARAACAQEGDHPQPSLCRRHRPWRTGQHALPGLLQRQEQTTERPALRWVSESGWGGEKEVMGKRKRWDEEEKGGAIQWMKRCNWGHKNGG